MKAPPCECLAWHHPLWRLVGKRAGVRPLAVWAVVTILRDDGLLAPLTEKERVRVLSDGAGEKPLTIALILAGLERVGVIDAAGRFLVRAADDIDEMVTKLSARLLNFVTQRGPGRPPIGLRAMTGAERTARYKARKAAAFGVAPAPPAGPVSPAAAGDETADEMASPPLSLTLFPQDHLQGEEEQKQTRAPDQIVAAEGFAELRSLWPLSNRMADAEREYRRALRHATAPTLLALARHYIETKPAWQNTMFLVNWLRTEPWGDPVLPLATPLRAVDTTAEPRAERPRSEPWVDRLRQLRETRVWLSDWGPSWGEPGCRAPGLDTGVGQGFHRYFANNQPQRRAG